ncbi:MAG: hypothetical protein LUG98_08605 [Tannerellaceae bacterium]|nr:hypothetical protein [Tannerellaceae bacterium]
MNNGYIPLSRKLFEHPFWQEKRIFSYAEAWIDLIRCARFERTPGDFLIKGKTIKIKRGEIPVSARFLSECWGWSRSKTNHFLIKLHEQNMIKKRTDSETKQTIIKLSKYDLYNPANTDVEDSGETTKRQQKDNINKENKEKRESEHTHAHTPEYEKFLTWMQENTPYCANPEHFKQPMTEEKFLRLKQKYTGTQIADILLRIENRKDLRKRYNDLYLTIVNWLKKEQYGT